MLALYTGMRQGEIAALRLEDIGADRIYIRHSWSKYEGLKETKTNECREIKIPPPLPLNSSTPHLRSRKPVTPLKADKMAFGQNEVQM